LTPNKHILLKLNPSVKIDIFPGFHAENTQNEKKKKNSQGKKSWDYIFCQPCCHMGAASQKQMNEA